jgi:hypothetical protein
MRTKLMTDKQIATHMLAMALKVSDYTWPMVDTMLEAKALDAIQGLRAQVEADLAAMESYRTDARHEPALTTVRSALRYCQQAEAKLAA